ncbi:MAG: hypothetical protein J6M47_01830 [Clostridia bacterium]|nr:hypothetical protein [Clostridia bacterium]
MNIKKAFLLLMCMAALLFLTGCESQQVKDAKEIIDSMAKHDQRVIDIRLEIESAKRRGDEILAEARQVLLESTQDLFDEDYYREKLAKIYGNCSDGERKQIDVYLKETYHAVIDDYR